MKKEKNDSFPFQQFTHFLHLCNDDDKHLLLIGNHIFELQKGPPNDPLSLNSVIIPENKSTPHFIYLFDPNQGRIHTTDIQDKILLATCFLMDENHKKALNLLKECQIDDYLSEKACSLLTRCFNLIKSKNLHHPCKYAIAMHILLLIINNKRDSHSNNINKPKHLTEWLSIARIDARTFYLKYLNFLGSIPARFRLNLFQERDLLFELISVLPEDIKLKERKSILYQSQNSTTHLVGIPIKMQTPCTNLIECHVEIEPSNEANETILKIPNYFNSRSLKIQRTKLFIPLFISLFSDKTDEFITAQSIILLGLEQNDYSTQQQFLQMAAYNRDVCLLFLKNNKGEDFLRFPVEAINLLAKYMRSAPSQFLHYEMKTKRYKPQMAQNSHDIVCDNSRSLFLDFKPTLSSVPFGSTYHPMIHHETVLENIYHERLRILSEFFTPVSEKDETLCHWNLNKSSSLFMKISHHPSALRLYQNCLSKLEHAPSSENFQIVQNSNHLLQELIRIKNERSHEAKNLIQQALQVANKTSLDQNGTISLKDLQTAFIKKFEVIAGKQEKISEKDLALWVLQQNRQELIQQNSLLSDQESNDCFSLFVTGMIYQVEAYHLTGLIEDCSNLVQKSQDEKGIKQLSNKIALGLKSQKQMEGLPEDDRLLAFEYLSELMLWDQQATILKKALRENQLNLVFQLMMGKGKTKVILPCFALLFADGEKIPFLIVPWSLKNQNLKDLRQECQTKFGLRVFTFIFSRDSDVDETSLLLLRKKFMDIRNKKGYGVVLTSPDNIQALLVQYIELTLLIDSRENSMETTSKQDNQILYGLKISQKHLAEIILLLQERGVAVIDEIHQLFKCLQELNFTYQSSQTLDVCEIQAITQLYQVLHENEYSFSNELFSDSESWQEMKQTIAQSLANLMPNDERSKIFNYILLKDSNSQFLESIEATRPNEARQIALWMKELTNFLPHTLGKKLNVHYGNSAKAEVEYAIPYLGNNTPSLTSEFGHHHVMLNYTLQMLLQTGLTKNQFLSWIKGVQAQYLRALTTGMPDNLLTIRYLEEIDVVAIDVSNHELLHQLNQRFGKYPSLVFDYFKDYLANKIPIHCKKINSNPQDLGDFIFKGAITLTGTPYNHLAYPFNFHNRCQLDEQDLGNLLKALANPRNQQITTLNSESIEEILLKIEHSLHQRPQICAFIDLAAFLKGMSNFEFAQALLKKFPHLAGIIYFDDETKEIVVLKRDKLRAIPYRPEECRGKPHFVYYDHLHSFGADIDLPAQAVALITLNEKVCFYQMLQAAKRPRQLETSQSVQYMIVETVANQIQEACAAESLEPCHLFSWFIANEAKELENEIIVSTLQKLKHLIRKQLIKMSLESTLTMAAVEEQIASIKKKISTLNKEQNPASVIAFNLTLEQLQLSLNNKRSLNTNLHQLRNEIFVDTTTLNAYEAYRIPEKEVEPSVFFYHFINFYQQKAPDFLSEDQEKINEIIFTACEALPAKIHSSQAQNLQQEVHKQEEKNNQIESLGQASYEWKVLDEELWETHHLFDVIERKPSLISEIHSMNNDKVLRYYSLNSAWRVMGDGSIFDENLYASRNFLVWSSNHTELSLECKLKPIDFFVEFVADRSTLFEDLYPCYLILSLEEADNLVQNWSEIAAKLAQYSMVKSLALRRINGPPIRKLGQLSSDEERRAQQFLMKAQVQLMLLNGQQYVPEMLERPFMDWVKDKTSVVEDAISKIHVNRKKNRGFGGNLFDILKKVKEEKLAHEKWVRNYRAIHQDDFNTIDFGGEIMTEEEFVNGFF